MLSATELTAMREQAVNALPDRCQIVRVELTSDGRLGSIETKTVVAADVPCRLEELGESRGGRDAELGGRIGSRGETLVRMPFNIDVIDADRIEIIDGDEITRALDVQRVIKRSFATVTTVVVSEVR